MQVKPMAMQRRRRGRATAPSSAQALLGIAAAALLLVAVASDAFVTAAQPSLTQNAGPVSRVLNRTTRAPAQEQTINFLRAAAATTLMCLAAKSFRRPKASSMRVQAVMSKSSGSSEMVHKTCKVEEVMLIDLADACRSCSEEVLQRTPARIAVNEATADTAVPSASAPVATRAKHQKARMVGQSRHCTHRFARAARAATGASTAKKARRTIGKSLNARVEPVPVAQSSFDPSTVRNSVQIGLRISSTLRSEKGRESKSPSSLEGSDMSTGLRIQANEFRE
ncbi:unnamed protein product [Durusdinium trenchii]|uniref:Uncharacterized protein n=3 Tax=Durusdinium trenchii TaxID=1381693 RepID=A0ABP0RMU1_9DINO